MTRYLSLFFIFLLSLAFTCCHSSRSAIDSIESAENDKSPESRFNDATSRYLDWNDVDASVKLQLKQPKEMGISGKLSMKRGENIVLSLRFLGMEVMSLYITPDSIFASDKIHKYYFAENLKSLTKGFPMAINDLQDMLMGRPFIINHGTLTPKGKKLISLESVGEMIAVIPKKSYNPIEYAFGLDCNNNLKALTATRNEAIVLQCIYDGHCNDTPAGNVAQQNLVDMFVSDKNLQAMISVSYDNAKWNTGNIRQWKKPKGYKRIYGDALINAITKQ